MAVNDTIGITGGIGAGKSVVSRVLRCNGFFVYDCDSEAKIIMVKDSRVKNALIKELGEGIYLNNGDLNREKLAASIFGDKDLRQFVNGIVHSAVREDIRKEKESHNGLFFIESAILATGKIAEMCDQIWVITAPIDKRLRRVMERDGSDEASVWKRMESQEMEISLLDRYNLTIIENDNTHPVLPVVLKKTDKFINYQEYQLSC